MPLRYILPPTAAGVGFDLVSQSTYQYMRSHKELEALEDFIRKSPTSKPEVQYKFVTLSIHGAHSGARKAASGETGFCICTKSLLLTDVKSAPKLQGKEKAKVGREETAPQRGKKNGKFPIRSPWKVLSGLPVAASQQSTTGLLLKATF